MFEHRYLIWIWFISKIQWEIWLHSPQMVKSAVVTLEKDGWLLSHILRMSNTCLLGMRLNNQLFYWLSSFSQTTWITLCWKVIMELLPNDAKIKQPMPPLTGWRLSNGLSDTTNKNVQSRSNKKKLELHWDVWASLCRMSYVSVKLEGCFYIHLLKEESFSNAQFSKSLEFDITTSLEANRGPISNSHMCDVETLATPVNIHWEWLVQLFF